MPPNRHKAMTLTEPALQESLQRVSDEVRGFRLSADPDSAPRTDDKWVLASNLQKAVRRGLSDTAALTATRLLTIEPTYFWNRLLVIAYEDVGLANPTLCIDLLRTFRRTKFHETLGHERLAMYFAARLATSVKSRALCDVTAAIEFNLRRSLLEVDLKGCVAGAIAERAVSSTASIQVRAAALRHLAGYRVQSYGQMKDYVAPNRTAMEEVAELSELDALQATLYLKGQGVSEGMNAAIPLVASLLRQGSRTTRRAPFVFDGTDGVLHCARDRHTRVGLRCISALIASDQPLASFLRRTTGGIASRSLASALFVVEGGLLDRQVTFPSSAVLRSEFEQRFVEFHGIDPAHQPTLFAMLEDRLPSLNAIRSKERA